MDSEGYVDIAVIASFNRIKNITNDIEIIRETLALSPSLEVDLEGWRVRKRGDWHKWVLPNARVHAPRSPAVVAAAQPTRAREGGDLEGSMLMGNGGVTAEKASARGSTKAASNTSVSDVESDGSKTEIRVDAAFPTGVFSPALRTWIIFFFFVF
jgi:hypothetical protein